MNRQYSKKSIVVQNNLVLKSEIAQIPIMHEWLKRLLKPLANEVISNKILLVTQEMVTNSIIHGNHEDINKKVVLHIDFTTEYITVEIQDEGSGIKRLPSKEESQELDYIAENGRGLKLAVLICDDIVLKGNKITLMFSRNTTQS